MVSPIKRVIITTFVLFIVITIKTITCRLQIGILKAIWVDKKVIMHNYGFQVIILGVMGIILEIIVTQGLTAYMAIHPVVTPEWSATQYTPTMKRRCHGSTSLGMSSRIMPWSPISPGWRMSPFWRCCGPTAPSSSTMMPVMTS
ncbi:MAG: hypothetical protein WCF90_09930 [Methanomicrobiales archaeon]